MYLIEKVAAGMEMEERRAEEQEKARKKRAKKRETEDATVLPPVLVDSVLACIW